MSNPYYPDDCPSLEFDPSPKSYNRVVCAAMLMDDGLIVTGVRHFSPEMRAVLHRIYGEGYHLRVKEQGFIDTQGFFLTRKDAWWRAINTGKLSLIERANPELFSEDLY